MALTFLLAAPAINPAVNVSIAVAFLGNHAMVVARVFASLATAVLVGGCAWRVASGSGSRGTGLGHGVPAALVAEGVVMIEAPREVYG